MIHQSENTLKDKVKTTYSQIAEDGGSCCGCSCGPPEVAPDLGYSAKDLLNIPDGSNLGLGCGNPQAIAAIKKGEKVLDLGCGGGIDCFLASEAAGDEGFVIGVDMTSKMIDKARQNALKGGYKNVEFRLGDIEQLPVQDDSIDVILSNCVINLSTNKQEVFNECFRVLKSGGRLAVSDIVTSIPFPETVQNDPALHAGCVAGALQVEEVKALLADSGFTEISVTPLNKSKNIIQSWQIGLPVEDQIFSANIQAVKP